MEKTNQNQFISVKLKKQNSSHKASLDEDSFLTSAPLDQDMPLSYPNTRTSVLLRQFKSTANNSRFAKTSRSEIAAVIK